MTSITRRQFGLFAGAAAGAAATLKAPAVFAASNMTKMRVGALPLVDFAPLYAAQTKGFFKAQRLDVTLTPSPGGAPGFTALASGDLQTCVSALVGQLVVADRGLIFPLVACGAAVGKGPPEDEAALIIPKGSEMTTGKQWNHKRIGINLIGSIASLAVRLWVDRNGGDSSTLKFVEIPFPQMNDALLNNRVDAIQQNEPFVSQLVQGHPDKVELLKWVFSAVFPNQLLAGLYASQDYIKNNRSTVEAFNHAYVQGVDWVNGHLKKPEFYELVSGYSKLEVSRLQHLMGWPLFVKKVPKGTYPNLSKEMLHYKMISKAPAPDELMFPAVRPS